MTGWIRVALPGLALLAVSALTGSRAQAPADVGPPDIMALKVQGCATCHGAQGQGTKDEYFPRIAGRPQGYLFTQLQRFREGHRGYPPMNYLLEYLHDDYLQDMAQYFAQQQLPFQAAESTALPPAQRTLAQELIQHGDPAHGVPACTACHGPQLQGINPGVPGLLGLHSRYISAQLTAWREGTRRAARPDCMHDVAARLSEAQVTAVAAYIATQSGSADLMPAAAGQWHTPVTCGSEPK